MRLRPGVMAWLRSRSLQPSCGSCCTSSWTGRSLCQEPPVSVFEVDLEHPALRAIRDCVADLVILSGGVDLMAGAARAAEVGLVDVQVVQIPAAIAELREFLGLEAR